MYQKIYVDIAHYISHLSPEFKIETKLAMIIMAKRGITIHAHSIDISIMVQQYTKYQRVP